MKSAKGPSIGLFTIGIAALFLIGFLLLVIFGAQTYRNTVGSQNRNNEARATLSYLSAVAKAGDVSGSVSVREIPEGQMLVIRDGSGYAQRIYCKDGMLLEDYGPKDREISDKHAQLIGKTDRFEIEERENGVLVVTTDAGESILYFRSEGSMQP